MDCSLWLGLVVASKVDSVVEAVGDKSSLDIVEDEGDKVLSGCFDEEVSAEVEDIVEDVEETDIVEDNFSGGVDDEVAAEAKEEAEHDSEALASGSVRKQYSSS